jgi:hypothetical protein
MSNLEQRQGGIPYYLPCMTTSDATKLAIEWGDKECPHPALDTVKSSTGIPAGQACTQCGAALDDIVASSTHE